MHGDEFDDDVPHGRDITGKGLTDRQPSVTVIRFKPSTPTIRDHGLQGVQHLSVMAARGFQPASFSIPRAHDIVHDDGEVWETVTITRDMSLSSSPPSKPMLAEPRTARRHIYVAADLTWCGMSIVSIDPTPISMPMALMGLRVAAHPDDLPCPDCCRAVADHFLSAVP